MKVAHIRILVLVVLILQNSTHTLLLRYIRGVRKEHFNTSTAVILSELLKMVLSVFMVQKEDPSMGTNGWQNLILSSFPMFVPAFLYFFQNLLQFVALSTLDSATFAVLIQLKLVTSAIFTVTLLGRSLSPRQWRALILLVIGVILVMQTPQECAVAADPVVTPDGDGEDVSQSYLVSGERLLGFGAVLTSCLTSGFAGIYFEKVLKSTQQVSIWERNFQLGFWSLVLGFFKLLLVNPAEMVADGFFHGYSFFTFLSIFIAAFGGIMVAMVVKYTDTIMKGYATSIALILTTLLNSLLFDVSLSLSLLLAVGCVVISLFNYNEKDSPAIPPPSSSTSSSSSMASPRKTIDVADKA